jgi:spore coat protein E
MSSYREIVTKAVVGKGKKTSHDEFSLKVDNMPNTVLGCWVINHKFKGVRKGNDVIVDGTYDINVWYSYDNDSKTAVDSQNVAYSDTLNMKLDSLNDNSDDIIIKVLKQPTVTDVKTKDGIINLTVEKELGVEVVGNTKVRIAVEDDYEEVYDEILDLDNDPELDKITEDYIN